MKSKSVPIQQLQCAVGWILSYSYHDIFSAHGFKKSILNTYVALSGTY